MHNDAEASHSGISMIATNAVGRPLGLVKSCMRVIVLKENKIPNEYVCL